jgi:hypothetical protein
MSELKISVPEGLLRVLQGALRRAASGNPLTNDNIVTFAVLDDTISTYIATQTIQNVEKEKLN